MEISSGENIPFDARYRTSEVLVKILVEWSSVEEVLKTMADYAKISWGGLHWGMVEHNIGKREFSLPNMFFPVTKSGLKSLELENQEMKLTIYALNADLEEAKKILLGKQPLVILDSQLS